jgi:hypothetical protein
MRIAPTAADQIEPSTAPQFSLRAVLAVVAIAAVLSSLAAPLIRELPPRMQIQAFGLFAALPIGAIGTATVDYRACRRRQRDRALQAQIFGGHLLSASNPELKITNWFTWAMAVLTSFWTCMMAYHWLRYVATDPTADMGISSVIVSGLSAGWFLCSSFSNRWLAADWLELTENGIVFETSQFLPWDKITEHAWTLHRGERVLAINQYLIPVPRRLHETVERILADQIRRDTAPIMNET